MLTEEYGRERCETIAEYIIRTKDTVRGAAAEFGVSKSTVHKDVSTRLRAVDAALFARVQAVLARNKAERHHEAKNDCNDFPHFVILLIFVAFFKPISGFSRGVSPATVCRNSNPLIQLSSLSGSRTWSMTYMASPPSV